MITLIYSLRDRADRVRVTNDAYKGSTVKQLFYGLAVGTLTQSTYNRRAGDKDLFAVLCPADNTLCRNLKPSVPGVNACVLRQLFKQDGALADNGVGGDLVTKLYKVYAFPLHTEMYGTFNA